MSKKPCIQCGKECDIFPLQLGDVFTLTLLRICSEECMFREAYDYLYEIGEHKAFRSWLYDKQNEEDEVERDSYIEDITNESIKYLKESLATNLNLLTTPLPKMAQDFFNMPSLPTAGSVMRFTRCTITTLNLIARSTPS
jgi:hypothetical protein